MSSKVAVDTGAGPHNQPGAAPRVSVVMSVYNDALRLETAVRSILDQTYRDLELIVIDDGSTDDSARVADRLASLDLRMRVVHQANSGLTRALIHGCELARGEFIARQDSDDWSHPERIADQVALLDGDTNIGFVSCPTDYVGPENEYLLTISRPADSAVATRGLLHDRQGPPAHGSVIMRKAAYLQVGGYRDEFHFSQDSDLWLRLGEIAMIAYTADVRYTALREISGASGEARHIQRKFGELGQLCALARREQRDERPHLAEARELSAKVRAGKATTTGNTRNAALAQAYLLGSQLTLNRDRRARTYLYQVLRSRPWHLRAWVRLAQSIVLSWR